MLKLILLLAAWPFSLAFSCAGTLIAAELLSQPMFHDFHYVQEHSLGKNILAVGGVRLNINVQIKNIQIVRAASGVEVILPKYKKPNGRLADVIEFLNKDTKIEFENYVLGVYLATYRDQRAPYPKSSHLKRYEVCKRYIPGSHYRKEFLNLTGIENHDSKNIPRNSKDISLTFDGLVKIHGFSLLLSGEGGGEFSGNVIDAETQRAAVILDSDYGKFSGIRNSTAVKTSVSNQVFTYLRSLE